MTIFPLNEFVNGLNLANAKDDITQKAIIKKILMALDDICPNSYMPFLFMYAYSIKGLYFKPLEEQDTEEYNVPYSQTLDQLDFTYFSMQGNNIFKTANEALKERQSPSLLSKALSDLLKLANDETCNKYVWSFTDNTTLISLEILKLYDPFFKDFEKNKYYDKDDFTIGGSEYVTNKLSYYTLLCILNECLPVNPDYDDTPKPEELYLQEKDSWLKFFDELILSKCSNGKAGFITIPSAFIRIANGLLEDGDKKNLFDPFNHYGQFALNINSQMTTPWELKTPMSYFYREIDPNAICITTVRCLFRGCLSIPVAQNFLDISNILTEDKSSLQSSNDLKGFYLETMPPFLNKVNIDGKDVSPIDNAIEISLNIAKSGSKAVCIIPSAVLISKKYENIRHKLIDNDFNTKLVLMPQGTLGASSSIATTILLIDGTKKSNSIKFVDASKYVSKKGNDVKIDYVAISNLAYHNSFPSYGQFHYEPVINTTHGPIFYESADDLDEVNLSRKSFIHDIKAALKEEVRQNNYSLNPSLYFDHTIFAPEGFESKNLADILSEVSEVVSDNGNRKIISARDLHSNDALIEINTKNLSNNNASYPGGTLIYKLEKGAYLLVSRFGTLSPTALRVSDTVYVNRNNVTVYQINDKNIVPAYLATEMRKNYFVDQLHYSKMVQGMVNKLTLRVLSIFVPKATSEKNSIELQQENVEGEMLAKMGVIGEQLKRSNDERFNEYILELRQRKHRISQYVDNIAPALDNLRRLFERNGGILKTTDIVSRKSGLNVGQYLDLMQSSVNEMSNLLVHLVDRNHWGFPEKINIEEFVNCFINNHIHNNYKFEVKIDNAILGMEADDTKAETGGLIINMPQSELKEVFENIIANAETWGFTDNSREDYVIKISLSVTNDGKIMISISNNGTPIDPKTDLKHLFEWGVGNHTGIGTYNARNIIRHYDGTIAIYTHPNAEDGFETEYEITIPRDI